MSKKASSIVTDEFRKIVVTINNDWVCTAEVHEDRILISGITAGLTFSVPRAHIAAWTEMFRRVEACVDDE
jgi:hypothetical protein